MDSLCQLSEGWRELVEKGDEDLVDLLANSVESKVGVRPGDDDVAEFLAGLGRSTVLGTSHAQLPSYAVPARAPAQRPVSDVSRSGKLIVNGREYAYDNAKDAMVIVLRVLASADGSFLERCSQHPDARGRKRRYIARTPEELYPDRPDLRDLRENLPGGWASCDQPQ